MGDDNRPLSEADITKFHERMRKLIDQGNPEAKNMLAQFDDAVEDGNWKKAVSEAEPFYRDVLIEIVVNTFKKDSCPEITEYRKN